MKTAHIPKVGMTVRRNSGLVCIISATYGGPSFANEPDWRVGCDNPGAYRHNSSFRGREVGLPVTCIICMDMEAEHGSD